MSRLLICVSTVEPIGRRRSRTIEARPLLCRDPQSRPVRTGCAQPSGAAEARLPTFWRLSMNLAPEFLLRDLVALFGDACQVEKLSECTTIPAVAQFFRPEQRMSDGVRA